MLSGTAFEGSQNPLLLNQLLNYVVGHQVPDWESSASP